MAFGAVVASPLRAAAPAAIELATPAGRAIAVSEFRPAGRVRGTIVFSHGANSAPQFYSAVYAPWLAAGFRILAPLHVDSALHPHTRDYPGLASWQARIEDMRAVIASLGPAPFVAAGHSYGGLVALMLGGSEPVPPAGMALPLVPRLARAVIALSPPAPIPVLVTSAGYGALKVPALVQTGTRDIVPGITTVDADGWKGHLAPFEAAAPGGHRYGLVIDGVDHYFGGAICDYGRAGPRQMDGVAQANRVTGLFLRAFGQGDAGSGRALDALVTDKPPVRLLRR